MATDVCVSLMTMMDDDQLWSAVCRRGHVMTDYLEHPDIQGVAKFCRSCGAPVATRCERCKAPLPGGYRGVLVAAASSPDPFCFNCGGPHPWATREQRVQHLENLLEFQELEEATQLTIIEQLAVLAAPVDEASDEERVEAGGRLMRVAPKLWDASLPVLQTLLTEAAKRKLGLSPSGGA
ncbi:MAG: DUF2321 domain-containing protein [Actinobacteria bacterium]|nr:DUF2321 domain-containing protein [Actinomycetota bacterium]